MRVRLRTRKNRWGECTLRGEVVRGKERGEERVMGEGEVRDNEEGERGG